MSQGDAPLLKLNDVQLQHIKNSIQSCMGMDLATFRMTYFAHPSDLYNFSVNDLRCIIRSLKSSGMTHLTITGLKRDLVDRVANACYDTSAAVSPPTGSASSGSLPSRTMGVEFDSFSSLIDQGLLQQQLRQHWRQQYNNHQHHRDQGKELQKLHQGVARFEKCSKSYSSRGKAYP